MLFFFNLFLNAYDLNPGQSHINLLFLLSLLYLNHQASTGWGIGVTCISKATFDHLSHRSGWETPQIHILCCSFSEYSCWSLIKYVYLNNLSGFHLLMWCVTQMFEPYKLSDNFLKQNHSSFSCKVSCFRALFVSVQTKPVSSAPGFPSNAADDWAGALHITFKWNSN